MGFFQRLFGLSEEEKQLAEARKLIDPAVFNNGKAAMLIEELVGDNYEVGAACHVLGGMFYVGETVMINGCTARIVGLERIGKRLESVSAGEVVLVNLQGVPRYQIKEGDEITKYEGEQDYVIQ